MQWLVDLAYLLAAAATAPIWLTRMLRTGKIRTDWPARLGRVCCIPNDGRPRVLLHAVSVGEVNAIALLVDQLAGSDPPLQLVIATTTDTGFARAMDLFGDAHAVVRYPLDFSWSVRRFLNAVRPHVVALVELELWPNFISACARRNVPVCVINGRLSERSFRRYRPLRRLIAPMFRRLAAAAVQSDAYAERFIALGAPPPRVHVTGTMKWDTARIADDVPGADALAEQMGINRGRPLIVAGSTAPGEHELLACSVPESAQLLCAPRKPEWFDQAAGAMPGCARRSRGDRGSAAGRFLLDTIGELRQAYALADLVVVGRTFTPLGGSDMIEPIALGRATIVGPSVENFNDTVQALRSGGGLAQCDAPRLPGVLRDLLNDPAQRAELAANGRAVIRANQGATARHAELIRGLLAACARSAEQEPRRAAEDRGGVTEKIG